MNTPHLDGFRCLCSSAMFNQSRALLTIPAPCWNHSLLINVEVTCHVLIVHILEVHLLNHLLQLQVISPSALQWYKYEHISNDHEDHADAITH